MRWKKIGRGHNSVRKAHKKPIRKTIILVTGLGARMFPAIEGIPKELLPVYDRPIIEHVVEESIVGLSGR